MFHRQNLATESGDVKPDWAEGVYSRFSEYRGERRRHQVHNNSSAPAARPAAQTSYAPPITCEQIVRPLRTFAPVGERIA